MPELFGASYRRAGLLRRIGRLEQVGALPGMTAIREFGARVSRLAAWGWRPSRPESLQLEDVARACEEEGRFEFMVVGPPLRLPGGTGSPWNPIAIF